MNFLYVVSRPNTSDNYSAKPTFAIVVAVAVAVAVNIFAVVVVVVVNFFTYI